MIECLVLRNEIHEWLVTGWCSKLQVDSSVSNLFV